MTPESAERMAGPPFGEASGWTEPLRGRGSVALGWQSCAGSSFSPEAA